MYLSNGTLLQGGKYKIVRYIGSGGFGCTYEAEHIMLRKRVAIKEFFVKDFCNRDERTARITIATQNKRALVDKLKNKFIDEARALCELNHPGIVKVSDIFEENGTAYYVMDYIDGRSLSDIVNVDGALPEHVALNYIRQAAQALANVHSNNRLHLDIKPGNIMVDQSGHVLLIDFGASKQYDECDGENTSTLLGKTPGYAPLEQMGNDVVKFFPATDIYSLGATLYKLLTGITPLSANLLASGEELLPLPQNITKPTCDAVAKSMQINKRLRPQTIEEFLNLLNSESNIISKHINLLENEDVTILDANEEKKSSNIEIINGLRVIWSKEVSYEKKEVLRKLIGNMIKVDAGYFEMGSEDSDAWESEKPVHNVILSDYFINKYEVTQSEWRAIMGNNSSNNIGDNLPVEQISWYDCQEFINRLNDMTSLRFRLPTEAEWEYAARGGKQHSGYKYSGSNSIDEVGWYYENSIIRNQRSSHIVGVKIPNELGLYDMSGNVWEWCDDYYSKYPLVEQDNPSGPQGGSYRVCRGGSWGNNARTCRISSRNYSAPSLMSIYIGMRLALSV